MGPTYLEVLIDLIVQHWPLVVIATITLDVMVWTAILLAWRRWKRSA